MFAYTTRKYQRHVLALSLTVSVCYSPEQKHIEYIISLNLTHSGFWSQTLIFTHTSIPHSHEHIQTNRYGECLADSCTPLPCRWDRMVTELGETGVLNVLEPQFSMAVMGQSNPVPSSDNVLTLTLQVRHSPLHEALMVVVIVIGI